MSQLRIIKRYRNRRLYDTHTQEQITLAGVRALVKSGVQFKVKENHTGRDLTLLILTQALAEEIRHWENWEETAEILRVLIQTGGNTGMTILSKTVLAAIGAVAITKENAEKLIDELIKRGELDKSKRAEAVREAFDKAEARAKETVSKVKKSVTSARARETAEKVRKGVSTGVKEVRKRAEKMRPARADEVAKLRRAIEDLNAKIEELILSSKARSKS